MSCLVSFIVGEGAKGEIRFEIVLRIAIQMTNNVAGSWNECVRDQPMNMRLDLPVSVAKLNARVSSIANHRLEYPSLAQRFAITESTAARKASHPSKIRYLVEAFPADHGAPPFFVLVHDASLAISSSTLASSIPGRNFACTASSTRGQYAAHSSGVIRSNAVDFTTRTTPPLSA